MGLNELARQLGASGRAHRLAGVRRRQMGASRLHQGEWRGWRELRESQPFAWRRLERATPSGRYNNNNDNNNGRLDVFLGGPAHSFKLPLAGRFEISSLPPPPPPPLLQPAPSASRSRPRRDSPAAAGSQPGARTAAAQSAAGDSCEAPSSSSFLLAEPSEGSRRCRRPGRSGRPNRPAITIKMMVEIEIATAMAIITTLSAWEATAAAAQVARWLQRPPVHLFN